MAGNNAAVQSAYWKRWYAENKEAHKARSKERTKRVTAENRLKLYEYLLEHPCVDCGEADPVVLEFDHVRGQKVQNVVQLLSRSWAGIMREIDKCEVVCANCHRRRTCARIGSLRYTMGS